MTQTIDPEKLRDAALHLEWVFSRYPDASAVQDLATALAPLLESAKSGRIVSPIDRNEVPGGYAFGDGQYRDFRTPNLEDAYVQFRIELRGGLTENDKARLAKIAALRRDSAQGEFP